MKLDIKGKCFCITGETDEYRDIYWALIVQAGGRWVKAVSRAVDYLVTGWEPGPTKVKQAAEYGIPCIEEDILDEALREALNITDGARLFLYGWNLPIENKLKYQRVGNGHVPKEREADDGVHFEIENKRICITGKLDKPRAKYVQAIKDAGGIFATDVSGNTDYLVVGDKPGSKTKRAKENGVPVRSLGALKTALGITDESM